MKRGNDEIHENTGKRSKSDLNSSSSSSSNSSSRSGSAIIRLNVGGRIFTTKRSTLCEIPDSMLATLFDPETPYAAPEVDDTGAFFLDRDPGSFELVLSYLRRKRLVQLNELGADICLQVLDDAKYFGLEDLAKALSTHLKKEAPVCVSDWFEAVNDNLGSIDGHLSAIGDHLKEVSDDTSLGDNLSTIGRQLHGLKKHIVQNC